jgi:hypothetical protein
MFTTPCFIRKNTPELRNKLEELGYTNGAWESPHFEYPYLKCYPNRMFGLFKCEGFYITEDDYRCDGKTWTYNPPKKYIDCGDNEELFIALASMTDDEYGLRDYYIVTDDYKPRYAKGSIHRALPLSSVIHPSCYRKATVEELINYFN